MRIGRTLFRHVAWRLTKSVLLIFVVFIVLVAVVDLTQFARFVGSRGISIGTAILISFLRGPSLAESVLPFAVLFGGMITFVQLNRRLELTVTRSAGVSAWQILLPAAAAVFVIGLFAITVYNPAAVALRELSVSFGGAGSTNSGFDTGGAVWLRQNGPDGPSIIGATETARDGTVLAGVTAFQFAPDGTFQLRVDAPTAHLEGLEWIFDDAVVTTLGAPTATSGEYRIGTNLSLAEIRDSLADPETVAFWRLPRMAAIANASGLPATDIETRLNTLLSLPFMLVAMILIAAAVSLKFSRTLRTGRLIVTGAVSGFVLYILLAVSGDLGRGGVVSPQIAAWAPVLLATLVSVTFLLREEDG